MNYWINSLWISGKVAWENCREWISGWFGCIYACVNHVMYDIETCELLWWKLEVAKIWYMYVYWCFECDAWKWFHECEDVGISSIEKRKMCIYVCSTLAKNGIDMCVDDFKLETHGNEPRNIQMLISIELWKEKCDVCG